MGKLYKGLAQNLTQIKTSETEKISNLNVFQLKKLIIENIQENYEKLFQLKMEIMMLKKGESQIVSARNLEKSQVDASSGVDNTKDSENVNSSHAGLPQLPVIGLHPIKK